MKNKTLSGWLLLDKPLGLSSNHALQRVKRTFNIEKAGFAGTLDPLATGMLPIALNEATKALHYVTHDKKSYVFQVHWGQARTTGDSEGDICATSDVSPSLDGIKNALAHFTGPITQTPPAYSALKINGVRAYELARQGIEFEIKSRNIHIYDLQLLSHDDDHHATFEVTCSAGTYIRSLAQDIALHLGTYGYVSKLHRSSYGHFDSKTALSLEKLMALKESLSYDALCDFCVLPITTGLDDIPAVRIGEEDHVKLKKGQQIQKPEHDLIALKINENQTVQLLKNETLIGFGLVQNDGFIQPKRLINGD